MGAPAPAAGQADDRTEGGLQATYKAAVGICQSSLCLQGFRQAMRWQGQLESTGWRRKGASTSSCDRAEDSNKHVESLWAGTGGERCRSNPDAARRSVPAKELESTMLLEGGHPAEIQTANAEAYHEG